MAIHSKSMFRSNCHSKRSSQFSLFWKRCLVSQISGQIRTNVPHSDGYSKFSLRRLVQTGRTDFTSDLNKKVQFINLTVENIEYKTQRQLVYLSKLLLARY